MELKVTNRKDFGKGAARKFRKDGQVPAIIYGSKNKPAPILVSTSDLNAYIKNNGTSQLLTLSMENEKRIVLFKKIEKEISSRNIIHIDFQEVDQLKKVDRVVKLNFVGTPIGVSTGGGLLLVVNREIHVSCLPKDIPTKALEINVEQLLVGDSLHASDITLPAEVELTSSKELPLVTISLPKAETAPAEEAGGDADILPTDGSKEPEIVDQKGTKEEK